jgi:hypothetical protein
MDFLQQFDAGFEGFSKANNETLEYLSKALSAGSGVDAGSFTGGRALIPESLDTTLVNILYSQDEARLFQRLKKQAIKGPVHQWDTRTAVGDGDGAWVGEGGDSQEKDQTIARVYATAKYLQTLRKVTLQASISNMIEDAMALEKNAGTLWIIKQVEQALFYGNSDYVAEQPDGLIKQISANADHVIDLRGADASSASFEDKMIEGCRIVRNSFGKANLMLCSTMVMADVQKLLRDRIRFEAGNTVGGSVFTKYPTPFGTPELVDNIFITEGGAAVTGSLSALRPGQPTIGSPTHTADGTSLFDASTAGNYYYAVVAVNKYGDSLISATTAAVPVASGEKATLPVTEGSPAATAYKVYRSKKGGSNTDLRYCFTVKRTGATQNIDDLNTFLPGCSDAFLLTMDPAYDAIEWAQFLPLMKFDLYPTNAAVYPFLMLLFGTLAVKKPVQHIRVKNIAPSTLGWF